jgi:hypothetical protein
VKWFLRIIAIVGQKHFELIEAIDARKRVGVKANAHLVPKEVSRQQQQATNLN